jgi:tRNA (guanine-N7-)-methyltransferase
MTTPHLRRIRSFVRRPGRITPSQQRALQQLWPRYGVDYTERRIDFDYMFGRTAPRILDIGFGDGEALLTMAANRPQADFLGVEVHEPGVGHLLVLLERANLDNVRIVQHDVVDVIAHMLEPECLNTVNIFFPDPWPKKRHHKRRLIQPEFLSRLAGVMKPGALLHTATDWAPYAQYMLEVLDDSKDFAPADEGRLARDPLAARPPTKFERRGQRLGHQVADFYYLRKA